VSRSAAPFALELGFDHGRRSASRLSRAIVRAIADGQLADGDVVPSTRTVAASLGIARSVVVEAYGELTAAGFFATRPGGGTWVEPGAAQAACAGALASTGISPEIRRESVPPARSGDEPVSRPEFDLRPGLADTTLIDPRDWTRAWRTAAKAGLVPPGGSAGQPVPAAIESGAAPYPARSVAAYLRQTRGLAVEPEDLFFFPGVSSAISVLSGATSNPGRTLAFENPGYHIGRQAFATGGAQVRTVPVDDEGLRADALRASDWGAYVTPAHQFPTGSRMSVSRRSALLDWAARTDGLIFEDDYDGEFRYDVAPMPPLKAMSQAGRRDRVVYIGTSSKILTPQLRVAWAVVPPWLRAAVGDSQQRSGAHVSAVAAAALASLIDSRALTRQINRAQRVYAARQARFAAACRSQLPGVRLLGIDAGMHILLALPDEVDDAALAAGLGRRGVACSYLSLYDHGDAGTGGSGLVCGYANLQETRAAEAVSRIRRALGDLGSALTTPALSSRANAAAPDQS
jgi:GntR family transcriptional regulator/MocR family aminotransferase